ncbi:MAG: hypothetical protein PVF17_01240 [Ignavibacteria bacterium]|jgi:minor curlin subunit
MKKLNVIIFILLHSSYQLLIGQQSVDLNDEETFLEQIESSANLFPLSSGLDLNNSALIQQMGNNNNTSINQTFTGVNFPGNIAEFIQYGEFNDAVLNQTGNGNSHFINQTGNNNMFEAFVVGDNNSSTIEQTGNSNVIQQDLLGNEMAIILTQIGNNNEIIQIENDQQSRQYQVIQIADGMKITFINGASLP